MADEIAHDYISGATLYACRFQLNGDVFLSNGASDEVWGTGGRDADDYDIAMPESGSSGHYVGDFDASGNIAAGFYRVTVYVQAGANPADSDVAVARGEGEWDGTQFERCAKKQDVLDSHTTTDALINDLNLDQRRVKKVYGPDEPRAEGVFPEPL